MSTTGLAAPASAAQLYLGRGDDLAPGRPLLTGDVFVDVSIDADEHHGLVMVVAHPCSMRGPKGRLVKRIAVAPIRNYQRVAFEKWPTGHFKVLPLPNLMGATDDQSRAVHLLEISAVRSEQLTAERRILALTGLGIHVLQQRLVYSLTRVEVGLDRLQEQTAHVLLEAELEEEWVDELGDDSSDACATASAAFAEFMDQGHRDALKDSTRRSDITREVRSEIRRRRA